MASKLDDLLPAIISAGDSGLSIGKISEKFAGKSKAKESATLVREKLSALVREGAIWGPFKFGPTQYYFADGRGPSIESDGIGQNMREVGETGATSLAPHRSRQLESCSELRRAIWLFRRGVPRAIFTERW